jgi:hypothetical protein
MKAIGGYFGLELPQFDEYHQGNAVRLNTGRNAFEYILLASKYRKVYIPYFTCDVMLEPLQRNEIDFEFYEIDENFEPDFDFLKIENEDAFLYTNYFGLKDEYIKSLAINCKNLILDNAQSFFSRPLPGVHTFYSPRKFFGLADGAYTFTHKKLNRELSQDYSEERFGHLLTRLDKDAESGYAIFSENDRSLQNQPMKKMSALTHAMLGGIDYKTVAERRQKNYSFWQQHLSRYNKLNIKKSADQVPMVYPFWTTNAAQLKHELIKDKIYCATYWPNVLEWTTRDSVEATFTKELLHLPIDQRYDENDLNYALNKLQALL